MTVEGKPKRSLGRPSRGELLAAALGKYVAWAEGHPLEAELDVRRLIVAGGPLSGYGMPKGVGKSTYYSHRDNDPRVTALDLRLKSLAEQRDAMRVVSRGGPRGAQKQASPAVAATNEPTQPATPDRAQLDHRYRELHLAVAAVSQQLQGRLRKPGHVSSVSRALFHTDRARASLSHLVSELTKLRDAWNRVSGEDADQQMDLLALYDLDDHAACGDEPEARVEWGTDLPMLPPFNRLGRAMSSHQRGLDVTFVLGVVMRIVHGINVIMAARAFYQWVMVSSRLLTAPLLGFIASVAVTLLLRATGWSHRVGRAPGAFLDVAGRRDGSPSASRMSLSRSFRPVTAMRLSSILFACAMLPAVSASAAAQGNRKATLEGVVRHVEGALVPNASVFVADLKRGVRSDADGRFVIGGLPVGDTLNVIVGRIGFRPLHLEMVLVEGRNEVTIALEEIVLQLDAIRTIVEQTGVFGVVGDTAYDPLLQAHIELIGSASAVRLTNALGQFSIDTVRPGPHMLEVRLTSFQPRLISFMQPPKGGTRLAVWMTPLPPGANARASNLPNRTVQALFDFRMRTRWKGSDAGVVTRDLLLRYGAGLRLSDAIDRMPGQYTKGARAADFNVEVEGQSSTGLTLADFNADDVEMVELFPPGTDFTAMLQEQRSKRWGRKPTSITEVGDRRGTMPAQVYIGRAFVWLRR